MIELKFEIIYDIYHILFDCHYLFHNRLHISFCFKHFSIFLYSYPDIELLLPSFTHLL